MNNLRQYIRNLLTEIYELSDEEQEEFEEFQEEFGESNDNPSNTRSQRRAVGLQTKEEIITDRSFLQEYQKKMNSDPDGKAMIQAFRTGEGVVCIHAIDYEGFAAEQWGKSGFRGGWDDGLSGWLDQYGGNSKDMISCTAWYGSIYSPPAGDFMNYVIGDNYAGFIMKGYPVFVSEDDVMSQTLGSIPKGLEIHQKHSGIAKRADPWLSAAITGMADFEEKQWAGEVLLDNWRTTGVWLQSQEIPNNQAELVLKDAIGTGLPIHIYMGDMHIHSMKSKEEKIDFMDTLFHEIFGGRNKS